MNSQGMRMGGQMGQHGQMPQVGQMPQGGQVPQRTSNNFKDLVFQALNQQPVPAGWQATFPLEERAGQIWQL